jgi:hypothetical protein
MKRPATPWKEKVDQYCRSYLEVYPEICRLLAQLPESIDLSSIQSSIQSMRSTKAVFKQLREFSEQHPELSKTKSIHLKPEFVQMMDEVPELKGVVAVGELECPAGWAEILETTEKLALFPGLPPELKLGAYFWLAIYYLALKDLFGSLRRSQYGAEPLDRTRFFTLAGQFFEMLAQACRGRPTQNKGRYDLELIGLVKMIQEHQTEKMSSEEIREALAAAGVSVPEGDTWRIWLWRARKAGLLASGSAAPTARSKKPQS